jgi:fructokinase
MEALARRFQLRLVACTRGANGSLLLAEGAWSEFPGMAVQVADTVGAGDAFAAAMTMGLLLRWPLDLVNQRANQVAAHVAASPGATPELPVDLRASFLPPAATSEPAHGPRPQPG